MKLVVAVVGAHCCGKTTLARKFAAQTGARFDQELGEKLAEEAGTAAGVDDETVLARETERDRDDVCLRVVETWHTGNFGWHKLRRDRGLADGHDLEARTRRAVREVARDHKVVFFVLRCSDQERRKRREKSGRTRLPPFDNMDEEEMFEATFRVGEVAIEEVRQLVETQTAENRAGMIVVDVSTDGEIEDIVDIMHAELLKALARDDFVDAERLSGSMRSARVALESAIDAVPGLRELLARHKFPAVQRRIPGSGVVPDGASESTIVKEVADALCVTSTSTSSPPLAPLRAFVDAVSCKDLEGAFYIPETLRRICPTKKEQTTSLVRRALDATVDHGFAVVYRGLVSTAACDAIVGELEAARRGELEKITGLNRHKWKNFNEPKTCSNAKIELTFVKSAVARQRRVEVHAALAKRTGREEWARPNPPSKEDHVTVFAYVEGAELRPHRDKDISDAKALTAVVVVGDEFEEGAFYVNKDAEVDPSTGHATAESRARRQRFPDLRRGDAVVFCNDKTVHGVERVAKGRRISASFRV
ncbi:hypothetical protein CTAYLR_002864 [Chrysophaeum taylorii]|uniref:Fe2OG dioxygenase domain-containing protein n=1 Tax=Chrysophaeum taylorii TaxID=2483200 RepID=A0AAD7U811_9STRA|nr:hypothetical protein CTAYLR_002864 [Chrysophaeum taylorii]